MVESFDRIRLDPIPIYISAELNSTAKLETSFKKPEFPLW